jgi:endonuclease/exonuclease/phosphatase family metal-dependent hydrolase
MENYNHKYLKYKTKYNKLKREINSFKLVSFNILNYNVMISKITFEYIINKFITNLDEPSKNKILKELAEKNMTIKIVAKEFAEHDKKRWHSFRKIKITELINSWVNQNTIVCLQEVPKDYLEELKKNNNYKLFHNNSNDIVQYYKKNNKISKNKKEHRVIILPLHYTINDQIEIEYSINVRERYFRKNCIMINCTDSDNNEYQIINLHLHYESSIDDIKKIATKIANYIDFNKKIIIAGDFNKELIELTDFIKILKLSSNDQSSDYTFIENKQIDHILTKNIYGNVKNISEYDNEEILYSQKIIDSTNINNLDKLISEYSISDHYPIIFNSN